MLFFNNESEQQPSGSPSSASPRHHHQAANIVMTGSCTVAMDAVDAPPPHTRGRWGILGVLLIIILILVAVASDHNKPTADANFASPQTQPRPADPNIEALPEDIQLSAEYIAGGNLAGASQTYATTQSALCFLFLALATSFVNPRTPDALVSSMIMTATIAAFSIGTSFICQSLWLRVYSQFPFTDPPLVITYARLIQAIYACTSATVAVGASSGRWTLRQAVVGAVVHTFFFEFVEATRIVHLKVADIGGSTAVHLLGGTFAWMTVRSRSDSYRLVPALEAKDDDEDNSHEHRLCFKYNVAAASATRSPDERKEDALAAANAAVAAANALNDAEASKASQSARAASAEANGTGVVVEPAATSADKTIKTTDGLSVSDEKRSKTHLSPLFDNTANTGIPAFNASSTSTVPAATGNRATPSYVSGFASVPSSGANAMLCGLSTVAILAYMPMFNASRASYLSQERAVIQSLIAICSGIAVAVMYSGAIAGAPRDDPEDLANGAKGADSVDSRKSTNRERELPFGMAAVRLAASRIRPVVVDHRHRPLKASPRPWPLFRPSIGDIRAGALGAGAVIAGMANTYLHIYGAFIVGSLGALFAVVIRRRTFDGPTADIHAVVGTHMVPGLLGSIITAIVAAIATPDSYGSLAVLVDVFPGRIDRTNWEQLGFQIIYPIMILAAGLLAGALTAAICYIMELDATMPPFDAVGTDPAVVFDDRWQYREAAVTREAPVVAEPEALQAVDLFLMKPHMAFLAEHGIRGVISLSGGSASGVEPPVANKTAVYSSRVFTSPKDRPIIRKKRLDGGDEAGSPLVVALKRSGSERKDSHNDTVNSANGGSTLPTEPQRVDPSLPKPEKNTCDSPAHHRLGGGSKQGNRVLEELRENEKREKSGSNNNSNNNSFTNTNAAATAAAAAAAAEAAPAYNRERRNSKDSPTHAHQREVKAATAAVDKTGGHDSPSHHRAVTGQRAAGAPSHWDEEAELPDGGEGWHLMTSQPGGKGKFWYFSAGHGLYFHRGVGHFYDAATDYWYDSETDTWITAAEHERDHGKIPVPKDKEIATKGETPMKPPAKGSDPFA